MPPLFKTAKFVGYNFDGFESRSFNLRDENGEVILNIEKYFIVN
jgi:hypothetical protein